MVFCPSIEDWNILIFHICDFGLGLGRASGFAFGGDLRRSGHTNDGILESEGGRPRKRKDFLRFDLNCLGRCLSFLGRFWAALGVQTLPTYAATSLRNPYNI